MLFGAIFTVACLFACASVSISEPQYHHLPPLREQAILQNAWRKGRIENIPNILRKHGVDAWLMSQREYAEDTVFWSLKSATQFSARRRTVHLFLANAPEGMQTGYSFIDNTDGVFQSLNDILKLHQPKTVVLNVDTNIAFAGGLHVGLYNELRTKLDSKWVDMFTAKPIVAVEYVATMPAAQLEWYKRLQETAWAMISDAFSERVITPGETTTEDVEWWLRDKIQAMNYSTWFAPDVTVVDGTDGFAADTSSLSDPHQATTGRVEETIIQYGDMLHVDFGVTALGMNTDTQHLAYVLAPDETDDDVPRSLRDGLTKVNRLQDIVRENMIVGKSGNDILHAALTQMKSEGLDGKIYCHPIGDWGHSAGTLIGKQQAELIHIKSMALFMIIGELPA